MPLIFLGEQGDLVVTYNLPVSAAEDKLAASEIAPGKHAFAFDACFFDDDVCDHGCLRGGLNSFCTDL
jgi:hypothetical protein